MAKSTAKRSSLFGEAATSAVEAPSPDPVMPEERVPTGRRYPLAKSREGKRVAATYLDEAALQQLKILAVKERTSVQDLLREGLNMVFEKRGLNRIA